VSATTDIVQSVTGLAALAVSVLALRESRLQRRASTPPPPVPTVGVPPTLDGSSPGRAPRPHVAVEWSTLRFVAFGMMGGATYSLVSDVWLRTTTQRLALAFIVLAATGVAFAYVRISQSQDSWLYRTATAAVGMSAAVILTVFIPPVPPAQSAVGTAVVVALAVGLLIYDRRRTR
jgi:hypothetical protein